MELLGLHHAGIHVTSLERSIAFYTDVFELAPGRRLTLGGERLAFLHCGRGQIELIEDGDSDQRRTGPVDHLALEVGDLERWLIRLREKQVELVDQAPLDVPEIGARILFCVGPDGERIELFDAAPRIAQ